MIRHWKLVNVVRSGCRTFLTQSYNCTEAWNDRLKTPIFEKMKDKSTDKFYVDIEQKLQQQRKISAVDIDLFMNKVTNDQYVDEMADLAHKLRLTEEAASILDSTSHALVRNFIEHGQTELLLQVLRDPLNYGIFLDTFAANLLLDNLLEAQNYTGAAEVATFMMLQEDFGSDISKAFSLYALVKYLNQPEPFVKPIMPAEEAKPKEAPTPARSRKGKKEENRVRVPFLRNDYFDDHFDIKESRHLVGKTFQMLSAELPAEWQPTTQLIGLCLHDKHQAAIAFVDSLPSQTKIYGDILEKVNLLMQATPSDTEEYKTLMEKLATVNQKMTAADSSFESEVLKFVERAVKAGTAKEIEDQIKIYDSWNKIRDEKLQEELSRLRNATALKESERLLQEMAFEEKKLWFFENEDKIDLEIESKTVRYPKRWFGKKKKPRVVDADYVPPEIRHSYRS